MINNSKEIQFNLNGLALNQSYIYEIKSAGGNWPAQVSPNSGLIIGNKLGNNIIYTTITFCATTGHCPSGESTTALEYDISNCAIDIQELFTNVKLSIIEEATELETIGYPVQVLCTDCFPLISIGEPRSAIDNTSLQGLSLTQTVDSRVKNKNSIDFYIPVTGLQKFEEYNYSFDSLKMNNWPVIINPISGSITPSTESSLIFANMTFCFPSGNYANNPNLLPYNTDNILEKEFLKNIFNLTISPKSCHGTPVTSAPMSIYCNNCLPKMSYLSEPNDIVLGRSDGNMVEILSIIDGLDDNLEYKYTINSVEGNWPIFISQASGNIRNESRASIVTDAIFCVSTGECPVGANGIMGYKVATDTCLIKDDKFSKMNISVVATNGQTPSAITRDFTISCDNCLPKAVVDILLVPPVLQGIRNNKGKLVADLSNLRPNQTYSYEMKSIEANWPVACYPISGLFTTSSETTNKIEMDYLFCPSTGACPNNSDNIIDYIPQTGASCIYKDNSQMFSNVQIEITPLSCYDPVIKSEKIKLNCLDCLPKIVIGEVDTISLRGPDGNTAGVSIGVRGLEHKKQYSYSFVGSEANWPIIVFPKSGIIEGNIPQDHVISTDFIFCATTGSCSLSDSNLIPYVLDTKESNAYRGLGSRLKGKLRFEIQPMDCPDEKTIAPDIEIFCYNCLPKISIFPDNFNISSKVDKFPLSVAFDSLSVGETYNYEIIEQSSNWPTYISPMTGQIIATSDRMYESFNLRFCPNTGVCPSGSDNILAYNGASIDTCSIGILNNSSKISSFKIQTTPHSYDGDVVLSDLIKVECVDCLPKTTISVPTLPIVLTAPNDSNRYLLQSSVSGLIVGQEYSYVLNSKEANWPIVATPMSGSFIAKSNTQQNISSTLNFCYTTGSCPSGNASILDYKTTSSCINGIYSENDLFGTLNLVITPESCGGNIVTSEDFTLICNKCLNPTITLPPQNVLSSSSNVGDLPIALNGLNPLETYSYSFSGISSNWPVIISPATGSFKANSAGTILGNTPSTIISKYYFCSPTGLCPSGTPGLIDYSLDSYLTQKITNNVLSAKVKLIIADSSCDSLQTISEEITLSCANCLPKTSYATIAFLGGIENANEIVLPTGCCSGVKALSVNVSNAIPGDKYAYSFSGSYIENFYPQTGYAYFNNGTGIINTIGTINIAPSGQSLVGCVLTHNSTNISSVDFIAMTCGTGLRVTTCN